MIENGMVIGDYYEGSIEEECYLCGGENFCDECDGCKDCICECGPCPCIFCHKHCDETCEEVTVIDGIRIRTEFVNPPIPDRRFDWAAWVEGQEESNVIGRGLTESDAVAELVQTLEDKC